MKYIFISGIPTSGKSYLAERVAQKIDGIHIEVDTLKDQMKKNSELECQVDFFRNKNEEEYWETITPEKHWENLVRQSEAFWPTVLEKIYEIQKSGRPAVFEGVNILPHMAHRDLDFPGIILLGESERSVFQRCREKPRWGKTSELQRKEAEWFFVHEGAIYRKEATKYNYGVFNNSKKAEAEAIRLLEGYHNGL